MYTIQNYVKAKSLEEAWQLNKKKSSAIIAGGMWIRMGHKNIGTAIDLTELGLNKIVEKEDTFEIDCMTSLRQLEQHEALNRYFDGAFQEALRWIVGTQFRNTATIGGSIHSRFGFSDPLTLLMALDCEVELFEAGRMPIQEFAKEPMNRDILVKLYIKKDLRKVAYKSFRMTKTDIPVLTVAVSRTDQGWTTIIGARPARAMIADPSVFLKGKPLQTEIDQYAQAVREAVPTGSNMRGSAMYRKVLIEALVKRAVTDIVKRESEVD